MRAVSGESDSATDEAGLFPIVADHPSAYLPGDRRRAIATGATIPSRAHGAALFADISGFTPLTEALANELGSQRASEVLTGHLNRAFHAVIAELDRFGGEVIYFSGDAITCWLDGDDGLRAAASGLGMQDAVRREGAITTPGGLSLQLGLKVAVAVGPARRFVVGDPGVQLIDVLAGELVDLIAALEEITEKGEVLIHESGLSALVGRAELGASRASDAAGSGSVVERLLGPVPEARSPGARGEELPGDLSRPWLLPAVHERLSTGQVEFLAELRPAYPLFVSFRGIDYDRDEGASEKLDEFVRAAQTALTGLGGNVLTLTLGDKGAYLHGVFGTPIAHEDDADRACAGALALIALEQTTAARNIRVGIAHGRLRSGTYGHAQRRTFGCLGDVVNLAARLMTAAPAGEIYASELVRRHARERFAWAELEPLQLKGKAADVTAFALTGTSGRHSRSRRYELPIVGRTGELELLDARLEEALAGHGRIVGLSAEAGMGKSRLIAEFVRSARRHGVLVALGECQAFGASTAYLVWREIWRALLGMPEGAAEGEEVAALEQALAAIAPALVSRAPLLGPVLGISIPDNELTCSFDPKLRKTSLESMLGDCLRSIASSEPVVLVLEDCHWLDPLSRDLLGAMAHAVLSVPVLLVLLYRPEAAQPHGLALARLPSLEEVPLAALDGPAMAAVASTKLAQLLGEDAGPVDTLVELVVARAQGNPFYAEELLNYIHSRGVDPADERALRSLELPESLHSLVLGRIDTLAEAPRRTLKVASVVGRVFSAPMLPGVYAELGGIDDVRSDLETLRSLDLVNLEREDEDSYLFKHAVTHEVAYESLPYALRATLHARAGRYLELEAGEIELRLDLLAHHYWLSDDGDKKLEYLRRAAEASQAAYANPAAIDYYERLAPLLPGAERVAVLLELCKVLDLVGRRDDACTTALGALELAESLGDPGSEAWCEVALADVARKQNRFDEAEERLTRAADSFAGRGDDRGLGQVLHLEGTLAAQRGRYDDARSRYEQSLEVRSRLGDRPMMASLLSNLGIVAEYQGDYELAWSLNEQALELRTELEDRWAIGVSSNNLGMIAALLGRHDEARARFEEAMRLQREVGDPVSVAITQNNLGNALRELGEHDLARIQYHACLLSHREREDGWALTFLLEDVGRLASAVGEPERALELIGAADALRAEIGAPRGSTLEQEIEAAVEPGLVGLGRNERAAARARGAELGAARALELATAFTRP